MTTDMMRKRLMKVGLYVLVQVLCLQNSLVFMNRAQGNDSYRVVIEFKRVGAQPSLLARQPGRPSYKVMCAQEEVFAYSPRDQFWVSNDSEIRAVKTDLKETFVRQSPDGTWIIYILFNKEFSGRLTEMSERNIGRELAIVVNGHLMLVPILKSSLSKYLDNEGQYQLSIPTQIHSAQDVLSFMDRYHL